MGLEATCEAGSSKQVRRESVDMISTLPTNLTQLILERIPLRHAVRMSILSRHWRYQWAMLPHLMLDLEPSDGVRRRFNMGTTESSKVSSNIINNILLRYIGPLKTLSLVNNGDHTVKLPSCLFSFGCLTHLTLINCNFLYYLSPTFKGFPCLSTMYMKLWEPLLPSEAKMLEDLISFCPKLQHLSLFICGQKINLNICAPNLQHLELDGFLSSLSLKAAKNIRRLDLLCLREDVLRGDFSEIFSCLLNCEKLVLNDYFWPGVLCCEHGVLEPPENLAEELGCLHTLDLGIPFNCNVALPFALCLFRSSPHLQRLCINVSRRSYCPSRKKLIRIEGSCTLECLKYVELFLGRPGRRELQLVKLLLVCSPVLEVMTIVVDENLKAEEKLKVAKEVIRFGRASPTVKIIFKP